MGAIFAIESHQYRQRGVNGGGMLRHGVDLGVLVNMVIAVATSFMYLFKKSKIETVVREIQAAVFHSLAIFLLLVECDTMYIRTYVCTY